VGAYHYPVPRDDIERRVVQRATEDEAFRRLLLDDPRRALEQVVGVALPAQLEVQVVEETPDRLVIVLPVDLSGISLVAARVATGDYTLGTT